MKKILFILMILTVFSASVIALDMVTEEMMLEIGMNQEEIGEVIRVQEQAREQIREADLEINVLKAQLERELNRTQVNMKDVEEIIGETLRWRIQSETARVKVRVAIKDTMGRDNWGRLLRLYNNRSQQRAQNPAPAENRPQAAEGTRPDSYNKNPGPAPSYGNN